MDEENINLNFLPAVLGIFGIVIIGTLIMYFSQKAYPKSVSNLPVEEINQTPEIDSTATIPIIYNNPEASLSATPSGISLPATSSAKPKTATESAPVK